MRYYPLNRVKPDQLTNGGEFARLNGEEYKGYYYETYDGKRYTGRNPIEGPSEELLDLPATKRDLGQGPQITRVASLEDPAAFGDPDYARITNGRIPNGKLYQQPKPYYPVPTETDYKRGAFTRYFAKKRNRAGFVVEVDKETFDSLQSADSAYDFINYHATSIFWQITGPFYDDRTNRQYKVAGIVDTNKRLVEAKERSFPGLKAYIGDDYSKFAKPVGK